MALPTLADVQAARFGKPIPKGKTRLQETIEARPLTKVDEKAFKAEVWKRDRNRCRCCGRKVLKTMARVPERGDVHHVNKRGGPLRFESRGALLLCLQCHEKVTGRVNERWAIEPATNCVWWFCATSSGERYIDARKQVRFTRVA